MADRIDQLSTHRPAVNVERCPARRGKMEGRIDIIGAAFKRLNGKAAIRKCPEQAQHDGGFAGA